MYFTDNQGVNASLTSRSAVRPRRAHRLRSATVVGFVNGFYLVWSGAIFSISMANPATNVLSAWHEHKEALQEQVLQGVEIVL